MIKFLIENKADVNVSGPGNHSVLQAAIRSNNTKCINIILRAKPNINNVDTSGHNVLTTLVKHYKKDDALLFLQSLLDECLPVLDTSGISLMHEAVIRGDLDIIDELVKRGVGLNDKDHEDGQTPLHYAAQYASAQVVQKLLDYGAQQIKDKHGKTPLQVSRNNKKYDKKDIAVALKNGPSQVKIATSIPLVAAELTIKTQETKKKKPTLSVTISKKSKKKIKVLPKEEAKETVNLDTSNPMQESTLSPEKVVESREEKTTPKVKFEKPKKTLIEKAQSFVVKAVTGSSSQEVVKQTYAAAVNFWQEQKTPEKRLHTFEDDHLTISVSSESFPKLIADHETNPLAIKHCSDHVERKKAKPDDYFHNFSYEAQLWLGQFAHLQSIKDDRKEYVVPHAQVILPSGNSSNGTFQVVVGKDRKTDKDIVTHRFFSPDKSSKNIPLLLPSLQ